MKAGPSPRCSTCVMTVHFLNHTGERSHCLSLTRTEAQYGQGSEPSAIVLRSICQQLLFSKMPLRIKGTVGTREVLYLKSDTLGKAKLQGGSSYRGILEAEAKLVLQDGLSF